MYCIISYRVLPWSRRAIYILLLFLIYLFSTIHVRPIISKSTGPIFDIVKISRVGRTATVDD